MHNVKRPEWNEGFPFNVKRDFKLGTTAVMATIKCDVHPWMRPTRALWSTRTSP